MKTVEEMAKEVFIGLHSIVRDDIQIAFKEDKVIAYADDSLRGIGKSTFLRNVSNEYGFKIVRQTKSQVNIHESGVWYNDLLLGPKSKGEIVLSDDLSIYQVCELREHGYRVIGFATKQKNKWDIE